MKSILILLNNSLKNDARVIRQANALVELGEVVIYSMLAEDSYRPRALNKRIEMRYYNYPDGLKLKILKHSLIHREYDFMAAGFEQNDESFDFCIANDLPCLHSALMLKKKGMVKRVIYDAHEIYSETIRQFFPGKANMPFYKRWAVNTLTSIMVRNAVRFERKAVRQLDGMMTVNNSLAAYFSERYGIKKPSVVRSIPDVTPDANALLFDFRKHYGWSDDTHILLYQGMLNPGRGLYISIDAMRLLEDKYKLVIIGDGPLKQDLQKYSRSSNLSERVKFFGSVSNDTLIQYTKGADIGLCLIEPINLSKKLSLPNKVFEYLHAGIPVLGSEIPEIMKIIEKNDIGAVSPLEPDTVAQKVKFISNNNYSNDLKQAAQKLNWQNEKEKLKSMLK
ncbi:MAG: glycosyltransferase family 4 protein [Bacteroidales bacterium]